MSLWVQAGGSKAYAPIAAAVAMAESGGNENAVGKNNNGSVDRGLWQINSIHGSRSTLDPLANAQSAVAISNGGTNWRPWVAYTTGRYKQYVQQSTTIRASQRGPSTAGTRGSGRGSETNPDDTKGKGLTTGEDTEIFLRDGITSLFKASTWLRVGEGILGALCIVGGVWVLVGVIGDKSGATRMVGEVVGIVGPGGKVAKVASVASKVTGKG